MNRTFLLVCLLPLVSCGSGSSSPTDPTPTPSAQFTLSGGVSETAPTASNKIPGATVTFTDGANAGKSATTDGAGNFVIPNVVGGGFTLRITATGYQEVSRSVSIAGNQTLPTVQMDPIPQEITSTRNDNVSGGDGCPGSSSGDGCKQYSIDVHNGGTITAVVTWTDRDTWLWLEIYRWPDGQQLASASSSRTNGLRQQASVSVPGHSQYVIRVRYALGARITPFTLSVTRPN